MSNNKQPDLMDPQTPEAKAFFQRLAMEKMMEMAPAVQRVLNNR